jgi:hypothetical protein
MGLTFQPVATLFSLARIGFRARVLMRHGIFMKRTLFHLRICYVRALSMKAQSSKKVISRMVLLTVAPYVNDLGGKTKSNS